MNWVQENKFLTGFIAVMVIGIGVLGFKVFTASGALEEATAKFETKASAYNRLRNLEPFPSEEHLKKFEAQKAEAAQAINAFQEELAKQEFPVEPMTPEQFQDQLKKSVTDIIAQAAAAKVKLPEKFFMGFDRYATAPPDKDAATALGRQLKAIEWVLQQLIAARIVELQDLKRPELPEEKGRASGSAGNRPPDRGSRPSSDRGGERGGRGGRSELVTEHPFEIVFISKQRQFADVLNAIVSPKAPQFFIPRTLRVTNQRQTVPRAVDTQAPPAASLDPNLPPPATPPPSAAPPPADITYIVGEELIEVALRLEIVDFAEVGKK